MGQDAKAVCKLCGSVIAALHPYENRVDWLELEGPEALVGNIAAEVEKYEQWAADQVIDPKRYIVDESVLESWYSESRPKRWVLKRWPALASVKGSRILDIGGSCLDSWRFLRRGAGRIDQVEISPASQRLGLQRLDAALTNYHYQADWRKRICFHTSIAESLPFQEEVFDIAFSRATIHHTQRPQSIEEIHRVLRANGLMFIIEPRLSLPFYGLMKLGRYLRRVDRGTDVPLRTAEIRSMRKLFQRVEWYPTGLGLSQLEWLVRRILRMPIRPMVTKLWERRVGNILGLSYLTGNNCYIVAQK
ncbi:MAG: class I SAM-dependent methyltransferase [Desulfobacterales bacterium]